ncbi:hypothetical protein C9374_004933 [Naegleria lovaniensis]|uniref:RIIa domain-containing protein n=1 Tax=Naegleria lovaniensis TaxID=51637 RepID=A0AA88GL34_NAELO|nr:uncharacterized protein C9374_004933 [Naegleria lovaniensis]KAG2382966.1 hypothetical protein C9374_004933 [Naegleria lovaniensis]
MDNQVLYSAEQIKIPSDLGEVIKQYTKDAIRASPSNLVQWSANYFANKTNKPLPFPNVPLTKSISE